MHNLPPPSTLDMLIPANVVGKVLGKGGENIANIRKVGSHILNGLFFYIIVVCMKYKFQRFKVVV